MLAGPRRTWHSRPAPVMLRSRWLVAAAAGLCAAALADRAPAAAAPDSPFARIAEPPPAPPKRTGLVTHVVQPGEVLWQIAEQYQVRPETILWANDVADPDLLLAGQSLVVPPEDG